VRACRPLRIEEIARRLCKGRKWNEQCEQQ
jgi:hypothetical protein